MHGVQEFLKGGEEVRRFQADLLPGHEVQASGQRIFDRLGKGNPSVAGAGQLAAHGGGFVAADHDIIPRILRGVTQCACCAFDDFVIAEDEARTARADERERLPENILAHTGRIADMKFRADDVQLAIGLKKEQGEVRADLPAVFVRSAQRDRDVRGDVPRIPAKEVILEQFLGFIARQAARDQIRLEERPIEQIKPAQRTHMRLFDVVLQKIGGQRELQHLMERFGRTAGQRAQGFGDRPHPRRVLRLRFGGVSHAIHRAQQRLIDPDAAIIELYAICVAGRPACIPQAGKNARIAQRQQRAPVGAGVAKIRIAGKGACLLGSVGRGNLLMDALEGLAIVFPGDSAEDTFASQLIGEAVERAHAELGMVENIFGQAGAAREDGLAGRLLPQANAVFA